MPEGDTIFKTARLLQRGLAGLTVSRFESVFPALNRVDDDQPIAGRVVESVTSRGKHLLITLSGDLILHTHMRMNGVWHLYGPGERWRRPSHDMRIVIEAGGQAAVGFTIPVAEFLTSRTLARHDQLRRLGPDLLDPQFDRADAHARLRARDSDAVADALLNQQVLSGLGNVLKSEVLFVSRIDPFARVEQLTGAQLDRLIETSLRLIGMNVMESAMWRRGFGRQTTGSLDPSARLWVYGRGGKPCRKCGTRIASRKTGLDARVTYWCPKCQAPNAD